MTQYGAACIFDAEILPARSLSLRGFFLLTGLQIAMGGSLGTFFIAKGAWPVALFLLGGIVLTVIAFAGYYHFNRRVERVRLLRFSLTIEDIDHKGRRTTWCLDPARVKLRLVPEDWPANRLFVINRHKSIEIGRDLSPGERLAIYNALHKALIIWQGGDTTQSGAPAITNAGRDAHHERNTSTS